MRTALHLTMSPNDMGRDHARVSASRRMYPTDDVGNSLVSVSADAMTMVH